MIDRLKRPVHLGLLAAGLAFALPASPASAQASETRFVPALDGIFAAFDQHPLVGLGDDHGLAQGMDFYAALVRDPRFAREVGNVVVEFGASGGQAIADRYLAGETVPYAELRTIWTDTVGWTPNAGWLGFARFLAAVRETNKALPPERRVKVWLGEPPVDWQSATREQVLASFNERDSHPAGIIEREILANGRKALVIYGGFHFGEGSWLRGRVEARHPHAFYVVLGTYGIEANRPGVCAPLRERAAAIWPAPALAVPASEGAPDAQLRDCATLKPRTTGATVTLPRGGQASAASPSNVVLVVEADAVLFLGPPDTLTQGPFLPDYTFDPDYRREMARRAALGGPRLVRFLPGWTFRKTDYAVDLDAPGYAEAVAAMFAEYDTNGDGVVTREEYVDPIP